MPAIPNGIRPVIDGYSVGAPIGVRRTEVGGGLPRYALDWDRGVQQFDVVLVLTAVEFSVWSVFFHQVIKKGAVAFDMPMDSGFGLLTHTVNIVPGTYSEARASRSDNWRVTFKVEATSGAYAMTTSAALAYIAAYEATIGTSLMDSLRPIVTQYSADAPDGVETASIAGGAPGYAMAWDHTCQRYQVTLVCNQAAFGAWTAHFHHVAKMGAVAFGMVLDSGFGPATHQVNIAPGSYRATRTGGRYYVSFVAEAEPQAYAFGPADAAALISLYETYGYGLDALLRRIDQFANVDTLALP